MCSSAGQNKTVGTGAGNIYFNQKSTYNHKMSIIEMYIVLILNSVKNGLND